MSLSAVSSKCPTCGSHRIYPSRLRSMIERLRRAMTAKQPYRCHACNHRGWYPIDIPVSRKPDAPPEVLQVTSRKETITGDDLDRLDTH